MLSLDPIRLLRLELRNRVLGRLRLRPGLPALPAEGARPWAGERAFYTLVLERALALSSGWALHGPGFEEVWDVGCRNWSYASALAHAFPQAALHGVELDAYWRYANLYRRADFALAMAARLREQGREASCHFGDFRGVSPSGLPARRRLFCFLYPFVSENPCRRWGLPARYAGFAELLSHALSFPGQAGLLSLHQGREEADCAREAYKKAGLPVSSSSVPQAEFRELWPSTRDAWILVASGAPRL